MTAGATGPSRPQSVNYQFMPPIPAEETKPPVAAPPKKIDEGQLHTIGPRIEAIAPPSAGPLAAFGNLATKLLGSIKEATLSLVNQTVLKRQPADLTHLSPAGIATTLKEVSKQKGIDCFAYMSKPETNAQGHQSAFVVTKDNVYEVTLRPRSGGNKFDVEVRRKSATLDDLGGIPYNPTKAKSLDDFVKKELLSGVKQIKNGDLAKPKDDFVISA